MKNKVVEHILSIICVSCLLLAVLFFINKSKQHAYQKEFGQVEEYLNLPFADFDDPFEKTLFKDVLNIYYSGQYDKNSAVIDKIEKYREKKLRETIEKANTQQRLTMEKSRQLLGMYMKFVLTYIIVMLLTYYGVQTIGVLRFVKKKQKSEINLEPEDTGTGKKKIRLDAVVSYGMACVKGIAYVILFSPAYVIAYSFRTEFNTDTMFFMILLAVISNGLLVMYANKFFTFLVLESRKGYVDTAIVKNLNNSYSTGSQNGISYKAILRPVKKFQGHVFEHIYRNAHHQYLSTIKEQASFLITGLVIIEMALNIHGHLNYELLQQLLYRNYDIVIAIILGIFYTVKFTELFTDYIMRRNMLKYENKL